MLKSNTINKIIAILSAIIIWGYVITVENPMTTKIVYTVPVAFTNMDMLSSKNLAISSTEIYSIDVSVEGKRSDTAKLVAADFAATADLLGWKEGEQTIPVEVVPPEGITILETRPANITVNIEGIVKVSKEIRLEFTETLPAGKEAGYISLVPNQIEVIGAKSQVDDISFVSIKLDTKLLTEEKQNFNLEAIPINAAGEPVYSLKLSQNEVELTAALCAVKEVPLNVEVRGEVGPMFQVTELAIPKTVFIRGSSAYLDQTISLTAEAIDISDKEVTTKIPLVIHLPDNVELANGSKDISASISIKGIATKEFQFLSKEIIIEGIPEGYTAHINTGEIKISIFGKEGVVSDFGKGDLKVYVDVAEGSLETETIDLPVKVEYEKKLMKIEVDPEIIHITLNKIDESGNLTVEE